MNPFQSQYRKVKLYKSQHEFEEFGKGKTGLIVCEKCQAAYYKKHWHHKLATLNAPEIRGLSTEKKKTAAVNFVLCPACQMIKNRQYEGEIILRNVPPRLKDELIGFINGFGRRAYFRDPLDRVIDIKEKGNDLVVTTTENEMASKLANKIKNHFGKVKAKTVYGKAPSDLVRIVIEWR